MITQFRRSGNERYHWLGLCGGWLRAGVFDRPHKVKTEGGIMKRKAVVFWAMCLVYVLGLLPVIEWLPETAAKVCGGVAGVLGLVGGMAGAMAICVETKGVKR